MEMTYIKPSMFELNEETGTYNATEALTPENIFSMAKYLLAPSINNKIITDTESVRNFLLNELATEDREVFACFFLNTKHGVISFEKLFYGTINGAVVCNNIVARRALLLNACRVICVHNHPAKSLNPSESDIRLTCGLKRVLDLIEVYLIDHFIVGGAHILSMRESGYGAIFE